VMRIVPRWCLVWLVLVTVHVACSTSRRRPERDKARSRTRHIVELRELLAEIQRRGRNKEFDDAEAKLRELETRIKKADVATITHKDYPDLARRCGLVAPASAPPAVTSS